MEYHSKRHVIVLFAVEFALYAFPVHGLKVKYLFEIGRILVISALTTSLN